jgi:hypothetical protein
LHFSPAINEISFFSCLHATLSVMASGIDVYLI